MKRYFITTNGGNAVIYVDDTNRAFIINESNSFPIRTVEQAAAADYSEIDGCTIDEMNASIGGPHNWIIDSFSFGDCETITEF